VNRDLRGQERISAGDAAARFAGVVLLVIVGYAHLLDLSHKIDEGLWLIALGFIALIGATICLAAALVRAPASAVRLAWVAAAVLCLGALVGYAISRILPLPGMADHQGDWINAYGVLAMLAELGLIALAAYAMRGLTVRGVPYRAPAWARAFAAGAWPASIPLLAFAALPDLALAHEGEEEGASEGSAASGGPSSTGEGGESVASPPPAHGDPFLGTVELGLALLVSLGFIAWAGRTLSARVAPRSTGA